MKSTLDNITFNKTGKITYRLNCGLTQTLIRLIIELQPEDREGIIYIANNSQLDNYNVLLE